MKFHRAKRDALRALTSEVLPYEVPVPFSATPLYLFLKSIRFKWTSEESFSVDTKRCGNTGEAWLKIIFDRAALGKKEVRPDGTTHFSLGEIATYKWNHPYSYSVRRNNGKVRNLSVPHPQSMLGMAYFIDKYADTILYFVNRSSYSIRHPRRVARLHARRDRTFSEFEDRDSFSVEQHDLEYSHVTTYFAYQRYNNINRFYTSLEFQACERKYPTLVRADVSKCFDSIYTHTIGWVTNGRHVSKTGSDSGTFGAAFDRYMQYLNHRETSGIIIGPEFSRIFAEIILQEVDVQVEAHAKKAGLVHGVDYEIHRYVDDYFIFLADPAKATQIEEVLAHELSRFKLHLNDHKREVLNTPLESHVSIAKQQIRESIASRTTSLFELDPELKGRLSFEGRKAITDYKAILLGTNLHHGDLANSILYELSAKTDQSLKKYQGYLEHLASVGDKQALSAAMQIVVKYLIAVLDVALFVYAGSPSVSHGLKLSRLISTSLRYLNLIDMGHIQQQSFRDKVQREILAQLSATRDESSFGVHTLNLIDCLYFLNPDIDANLLSSILARRGKGVEDLDAFGVMTFLRCCSGQSGSPSLKVDLLNRAARLVQLGEAHKEHAAERIILRISLPTLDSLSIDELASATQISKAQLRLLRKRKTKPGMFAWDANDHYHERLLLKSAQMVY